MKGVFAFAACLLTIFMFLHLPDSEIIYASKSNANDYQASCTSREFQRAKKPRDLKIPDKDESKEELEKTALVAIDPGHGGEDPGASIDGLKEKDINLDISLRVNSILKLWKINTLMIRSTDVFIEPAERIYTANKMNASLYMSIHCNWFKDPSQSGTMTLFYPSKGLSAGKLDEITYARIIQNELSKAIKAKSMGIKENANLSVLKHAAMPSVIVELGFLSNRSDMELLSSEDFRQKAAEAIARGIRKSLGKIR